MKISQPTVPLLNKVDKETQLLSVYQDLRDEIKRANTINNQTLTIIIGAMGVILTAGITQPDAVIRSFIFLVVYAITIPGYGLLRGNRRHIWRVSTYIRVFLEPNLDEMQWETRLDAQRKLKLTTEEKGFRRSSFLATNEWFIIVLLNTVAAIAIIFLGVATINMAYPIKMVWMGIVVFANLLLFILLYIQEKQLRRGGKAEENFYNSWLEIKKIQSEEPQHG